MLRTALSNSLRHWGKWGLAIPLSFLMDRSHEPMLSQAVYEQVMNFLPCLLACDVNVMSHKNLILWSLTELLYQSWMRFRVGYDYVARAYWPGGFPSPITQWVAAADWFGREMASLVLSILDSTWEYSWCQHRARLKGSIYFLNVFIWLSLFTIWLFNLVPKRITKKLVHDTEH